ALAGARVAGPWRHRTPPRRPRDTTGAASRSSSRLRCAPPPSARRLGGLPDHDAHEPRFGLVGLVHEAPVFELWIEKGRAPAVPHLEPLTGSEGGEGLQDG